MRPPIDFPLSLPTTLSLWDSRYVSASVHPPDTNALAAASSYPFKPSSGIHYSRAPSVTVVRRTGHSSFYVEKGMGAMGKTPQQLGLPPDLRIHGGAFPIWLQNAPCCPIAVVACYSGSSADDHHMVVNSVRDYLRKMSEGPEKPSPVPRGSVGIHDGSTEWISKSAVGKLYRPAHFEEGHESEVP